MTEDERAIRNLVDTWMQATRAGDGAAVLDLMTEDAVFMVPGREPFGRQAFAEAAQGMRGGSVEARSEIRELKVLGDWAYMRSYIEVTVTPSQGPSVPRRPCPHHPAQGGGRQVAPRPRRQPADGTRVTPASWR